MKCHDWVAQRLRADRDLNRHPALPNVLVKRTRTRLPPTLVKTMFANRLVVEASRARACRNGGLRARGPGRHRTGGQSCRERLPTELLCLERRPPRRRRERSRDYDQCERQ